MTRFAVTLPREPDSVPLARAWLAGLIPDRGRRHGDAMLLLSELVTNAVRHGRGETFEVRAALVGRRILVEVVDEGEGFVPLLTPPDPSDPEGRGLLIVGVLADRWGVHEGSTHVWFELALD